MPPEKTGKGRSPNRSNRAPREVKEFEEHLLQLDRVTRVVKGGRRMRFRATVIIGDRAGRVGLGLGKGNDTQIAVRKAVAAAKKTIITVPIVGGTIPHEASHKFKAAKVLVMPAVDGTGLIAGGALRKMLEMAGVKNVLSKSFGTSNRVVVAQAAHRLLAEIRMTEAAKKFLAELKKERDEHQKKRMAAAAAQAEAGNRRGPRGAPRAAAASAPAPAAAPVVESEKGRLETESEAA